MEKLMKKLDNIKDKLNEFNEYLTDIEARTETLDSIGITVLKERTQRFEGLLDKFEEVQAELMDCEELNSEEQKTDCRAFTAKFFETLALAKHLLSTFETSDAQNGAYEAYAGQNLPPSSKIVLPPLELPKFDGSFEKWWEFRDTFNVVVHSTRISDVQKFQYLRSSLEDAAAEITDSMDFCAANYQVAWEILNERYNNPRLLVHNHIKGLFSLEAIHSEDAQKLRRLVDTVSKHLRALRHFEQPIQHWDTLIVFMVASKLDGETARRWEESKTLSDSLPSWNDLKKFLNNRANSLEMCEASGYGYCDASKSSNESCFFCSEVGHEIISCESFLSLSVDDRKKQIYEKKICNVCLKPGHYKKWCYNFAKCSKCGKKHHDLLHENGKA